MSKKSFLIITFLLAYFLHFGQSSVLEDPELMRKPRSNIMVSLIQSLEPIYEKIAAETYLSREIKVEAIFSMLREATSEWHQPIINEVEGIAGAEATSFWITNQVYIKKATPQLIARVLGIKSVKKVAEEKILPLNPPINPTVGVRPNDTEWNIQKIGCEEVWKTTKGNGIIIGIIDTGVIATHESLKDNFIGWKDFTRNSSTPSDYLGHGTHVAGVISGRLGIGVASESKFKMCRACDVGGCPDNALKGCGQWMLTCPNCSGIPHIVSNSWGGPGGNPSYQDIIKAWNVAGIISVFSAGNSGPNCGSAGSPADLKGTIGVGSSNKFDNVSSFSARGPKVILDGDVAPMILAPGEYINSAYNRSDTDYEIMAGTSMSAPHVSGAIALLLSYNENLTLENITDLLFSSAERTLPPMGQKCGLKLETEFPNDIKGYGRLDIAKAFAKLVAIMEEEKKEKETNSSMLV